MGREFEPQQGSGTKSCLINYTIIILKLRNLSWFRVYNIYRVVCSAGVHGLSSNMMYLIKLSHTIQKVQRQRND